jgi:hypothetical protein
MQAVRSRAKGAEIHHGQEGAQVGKIEIHVFNARVDLIFALY